MRDQDNNNSVRTFQDLRISLEDQHEVRPDHAEERLKAEHTQTGGQILQVLSVPAVNEAVH